MARFARSPRLVAGSVALAALAACSHSSSQPDLTQDPAVVEQGKQIFRFDTFGDETFWTDTLHMNQVFGSAVDPTTALSVGLKVDSDALPPTVVQGIQNGTV